MTTLEAHLAKRSGRRSLRRHEQPFAACIDLAVKEIGGKVRWIHDPYKARAHPGKRTVEIPRPTSARNCAIGGHECGHVALHRGIAEPDDTTRWLRDLEADAWWLNFACDCDLSKPVISDMAFTLGKVRHRSFIEALRAGVTMAEIDAVTPRVLLPYRRDLLDIERELKASRRSDESPKWVEPAYQPSTVWNPWAAR